MDVDERKSMNQSKVSLNKVEVASKRSERGERVTHQTLPGVGDGGDVHRLALHSVDETNLGHGDGTDHVNPPADRKTNAHFTCKVCLADEHEQMPVIEFKILTCHLWFSSELLLLNCTNSRPATIKPIMSTTR